MLSKKIQWEQLRSLSQTMRWVCQMAWATNRRLLIGFLVMAVLESVLPAAIVLTGRGPSG